MNKAFIAICFWQSLPDLPPLGRHVPLTAFYRLVKGEFILFSFEYSFLGSDGKQRKLEEF